MPGDTVTLPAGSPVPEREICCGLLESESVKVSIAARAPMAVGVKRMVSAQLEFAARVEPQVDWLMEKSPGSAPVNATPLMETGLEPLLASVADCG